MSRHRRAARHVRASARSINVVDGQELSIAREIKTQDEITLLNMSAMMVDAAYYDLYKAMKPGMRENEAVALVAERLCDLGSDTSKPSTPYRTLQPTPHVFSDRVLRPGDPVYYDILHSHGLPHLLLPDVLCRLRITRHGGCA